MQLQRIVSEKWHQVFNVNEILVSALIAFVFCCFCVPLLSAQAERLGLVDLPGGRKQHTGNIPIVGGISVYLSVLVSGVLLGFNIGFFLPLILSFPIVMSGLIDDQRSISPLVRIPIQIICAVAMVFIGQIEITNIGNISGFGPVLLTGVWALLFTAMCTVGVINSINMIDGIDGLSGCLIALIMLPIIFYAWISQDWSSAALLISLNAAIFAFIFFNSRLFRTQAKVFLGDAGSTFLGFIIVWHLIKYTQGEHLVLSPVSAGWIMGLPLVDTVAVMVRRIIQKRSPLAADRNHLHHRFLDAGLGVNKTVLVMLGIQIIFIIIGVASNAIGGGETILFWAFVLIAVLHFQFTPNLIAKFIVTNLADKSLIESNTERAVR